MFIWLLYEFISSLIITGLFIALSSYFASTWIMGLGMAMCAILFVWIKRKKINYPIEKQFSYYMIYTILVLCICLFISKGAASHQIWAFYNYALIPSIPTRLFAALYNDTMVYYLLPLLWQGAIYIGMVIVNKDYQWKHHLKLILSLGIGLSLCGVILYQRRQVVLPGHGFDYSGGYSSVDLKEYDVINQNNKLAQLDEPSAFIIHDPEKMPVLDGAEAAYPVYSALANAVYENIAEIERNRLGMDSATNEEDTKKEYENTDQRIVSFYNTAVGFERLVNGKVDMFFGAYPSASQLQLAKDLGAELEFTPIGKEAFVFFVPKNHTIKALSSEQIRKIYSGEYTNWKQLGGNDQKIMAFQRPERSGSQSMMVKFMGDIPLKTPLKEEYQEAMAGIAEKVADYRNQSGAIGYSFRFFLTGMTADPEVDMLSVDGIYPDKTTIRDGTYPLTVNLYCITVKGNKNENVNKMLEFILSEQGQTLVEKSGYVAL
ncbi:PstS family phosphate ABC transporter substrate-binding protein [Beduini massiliensis]|uniref:PstS family phosphate ABC transporter substrate-binding protein n=1 Tax=Beduini massiliensis TaxID=1585974 RepID=UPI00059A9B37|nr:substrate-binding domain-containing protein [Beduini massiliensis]